MYFRGGYLCFSRIVRLNQACDKDASGEESSVSEKQRHSTLTYIAKHMTSASGCPCQSDSPLTLSDIQTVNLFKTDSISNGDLAGQIRIEPSRRIDAIDCHEPLVHHLQTIANRRDFVVARESSQFCKAIRLDNSSIRYMRQRKSLLFRKTASMQLAFALLTAILGWQLLSIAGQYQQSAGISAQTLKQQAVLARLTNEWNKLAGEGNSGAAIDPVTAGYSGTAGNTGNTQGPNRYRGYTTDTIASLIDSRWHIVKQSLVQPLAFLVKSQSIINSAPEIVLDSISWEPAVLTEKKTNGSPASDRNNALNVTLNGRVQSDSPVNEQLALFESYVQVLRNAYAGARVASSPVVSTIDYPFDVDPESTVSSTRVIHPAAATDASNFQIDMSVGVNTFADQVQEAKNLLIENTPADTRLFVGSLY